MLVKLLKYELKATARIFVPLYLLLTILSIINRVFLNINANSFTVVQVIAYGALLFTIIGIFVTTLLVTIQRFYKNLLSDEGYLSFTLPVKTYQHIISKGLIGVMWFIIDVVLLFITGLILLANGDFIPAMDILFEYISQTINQYGSGVVVIGIQFIILGIISIMSTIAKIYAATTMTNFTDKHKILVGIGAYIGFDIIEQTILAIIVFIVYQVSNIFDILNNVEAFASEPIIIALFGLSILIFITGSVYFYITNWVLKNKLNLE